MRLFDNAAIRIELFPKRKRKNNHEKRDESDQFERSQMVNTKLMGRRSDNKADIEQSSTMSWPFPPKKSDRQVCEQQMETPTSPLSPASPFSPMSQDSDDYESEKSPQKTAPNTFMAIQKAREEAARNQSALFSPITGNRMAPSVERLAPHSAASIGNLYLPQKSPNTHNKISENMAAALLGKKSREDLKKPLSDQLSIQNSRDDLKKKSSRSKLSGRKSREVLPRKDSMRHLTENKQYGPTSQPPLPNSSPPKASAATQTSSCDTSKPLPAKPLRGQRSLDTIRGPEPDVTKAPAIVSNTTANSTIAKRRYSIGSSIEKSTKANNRVEFSQTSSKKPQPAQKPQQKSMSASPQRDASPQPYSQGTRQANGSTHIGFSMQRSERPRNIPKVTLMDWDSEKRQQKSTEGIMNRSKNDYRRANDGVYSSQVYEGHNEQEQERLPPCQRRSVQQPGRGVEISLSGLLYFGAKGQKMRQSRTRRGVG